MLFFKTVNKGEENEQRERRRDKMERGESELREGQYLQVKFATRRRF